MPEDPNKTYVAGYRYSDSKLHVIHHTSVPTDSDAAVAYMRDLNSMGIPAVYVERREPDNYEYKLLPDVYDPVKDEFRKVGT